MCRWLAYSGAPVYLEELLLKPEHSLIDQSLSADQSETTTNGDGFGVGWFGSREHPGVYRDIQPAWNDLNLRDLAEQIQSHLFLAHVRAATGTAVQQTNCHPFRFENWVFVHNGSIAEFARIKRQLSLAIAPELYPEILGTTDSETMFYLALTFGLRQEPIPALERMTGFVEQVGREHGIESPLQMTLGLMDGQRLYSVRYSSIGRSRTLYHSPSIKAMKKIFPELENYPDHARAVVSEPFGKLSEYWEEIGESSVFIVDGPDVETLPFTPRSP
jgi:glutamine amidotransferase